MKTVVIGSGAMGAATTFYLLNEMAVTDILLIDNNQYQLDLLVKRLHKLTSTQKLQTLCLDVSNLETAAHHISNYDIIIGTVPWQATVNIIKIAISTKKPFISITRPDYTELAKIQMEIPSTESSIMIGCGLEPGLTEILANHVANHFSHLDTLHIRCGGIPLNPTPPLFYKSTFTSKHLPVDMRSTYFIEQGKLKQAQRFSAVEKISIPEIGELEAWHDGMLPWLIELPSIKQTQLCTQKTLRWPGFAEKVSMLTTLGLLNQKTIEVDGNPVIPRHVVETILKPTTTFNEHDRDVVALQIVANGTLKDETATTLLLTLLDYFDENTGFTAMARTTGYTAAICALLMITEPSLEKGFIRPENFFQTDRLKKLIHKLAASNINFTICKELP